ncbi:DNA translocase FtsK 4TM domain-containing protein, partial [Oceanospirillaceae bacterium]|nr:DNA translocase FtsK 4TM domain-containing protein [Oceanospirillaceae bacterium]
MPAKTPHSSPPHANGSNSSWIHKLSWRGYHFALVAFSVYLLIVLATFDASDPTSTQVFDTYDINNAGGTFGAILADLFFWALGIIAYLIPILIIQYEVTRFIGHSRYAKHETQSSVWFKGLSFSTLIVAACVYAFIHITNTGSIYPQGSGGLLGLTLGLPL